MVLYHRQFDCECCSVVINSVLSLGSRRKEETARALVLQSVLYLIWGRATLPGTFHEQSCRTYIRRSTPL